MLISGRRCLPLRLASVVCSAKELCEQDGSGSDSHLEYAQPHSAPARYLRLHLSDECEAPGDELSVGVSS